MLDDLETGLFKFPTTFQGAFLQQLSINKKKDIVSIALKNDSIR